tara:strand:+ start:222 stop:506 length:285 start_codon:yes stop_codon:yes gene_type:complete
LVNKNNPSRPPYVKDAICRPIITIAESLSSKISAIPIRTDAQNRLTILEVFIDDLPPHQSTIVEDARELIEELRVDMAADNIPASNNPRSPVGK